MNNALLYLGGILITALAVLFAVPRFVDWNSYRGIFEEEASRILGREVRVGGAVNVRLLPAPYVSFERLRIADIGDEGGNSIIRVESFTMWLSVPPLLRGVLEAHRVELRRPVINLATNESGSGNWRTLAITPGAFRFAPKEVALQSVQITDGAVVIAGPTRNELARFDAINGEFNAEALEGPFRFKGEVNWDGAPRNLRVSTAKIDNNGDLRFKAAVDVVGSSNSYVLDARLSDIKNAPALDGELTAKLAVAPGAQAASGKAAAPSLEPVAAPVPETPHAGGPEAVPSLAPASPTAAASGGASGFELKSKIKGTTLGFELADIAVSLEAGATPQLITGDAKVGWADKLRLDVQLASRWLDLDQLSHSTDARMPLEAGRSYFEALASVLPAEADTNAQLDFDQLTLGGEPISNVHLAASRAGGPLELKGVRADLPGGVRLELDGILTPTGKVPRLDGALFVSGKSLTRFLAWGVGNTNVSRDRNDGSFSIDGKFALGDGTLALTDTAVEFAGTPLTGELKLDLGQRKKLAMAIEGPRVDVAQFGSGLVGLNALRGLLFGGDAPAAPADATTAEPQIRSTLFDPATADLSLDLKVAKLLDGPRVLKDVDAVVRLERGTLSMPRLKFSTPEGLYIEAEGEAKDVPARPQGAIRGLISAPNAAAGRALLALLDVEDASLPAFDRFARLAPFRLAGSLELSGGAANASTLDLDGTLGGGRLTASLRLDGGIGQWRTAPLDVQASADNPDVAALVATLFDTQIKATAAEPPRSGRVVIKATGVPAQGLLSLADVTAEGLSLGYRGQVRLPAPGETQLAGDLSVSAADARVALALAGVSAAEGAAGVPIGGTVHVRREGPLLTLGGEAITLGDSIVSGKVALKSQDGKQTIDARLAANKASFAALLSPILGKTDALALDALGEPPAPQPAIRGQTGKSGLAARPQAEAELQAARIVWPEQSFDLALLDRLNGTIDVKIGALAVEPGLTIGNAHVVAELQPAAIRIAKLEGNAVGGRLSSQLELGKAPAGVTLTGSLRIDVASKATTATAPDATNAAPQPGDAAAFAVTFTSRALSPAALLSAVNGKGELTIGDATLNGNSPAAVSAVARAALTGQGPSSGNALAEAVKASLKQGEVNLGKIAIPVEISDGALKLERVRVEMGEGRSTFNTAVELATMKVDSEWQIEPKLDKGLAVNPTRAFLPAVTVVYTGKLSEFANLVPQVSTGALERELVVRKMEIDVGELERLRKLDEERARQDAERRKALEEDQAPVLQSAPFPVEPPPGSASQIPDNGELPPGAMAPPGAEAAAPEVAPSPAAQRPAQRRKRPAEENWRPFETPY